MNHLICPICAAELLVNTQGLSCANRHQYDRAKEGYFNLLPVQQKHSREPGDGKQQLQSRRAFLTAGFFAPLLTGLQKVIPADTTTLLDIGCGEGYFTTWLSQHCYSADVYGIDIAKAGVRMAAKGAPARLTYAVASSYALPVANESMDVITRIYAPSKDQELLRVLKPDGKLIIVTPGKNHLVGLREKIYAQIKPHPEPKAPEGFSELEQHEVNFPVVVPTGELTSALLEMTPLAWRLTPELKNELIQSGMQDLADFRLSIYRKQ
jgi:23S rRNA (guanine745-N1)-methyltransferase